MGTVLQERREHNGHNNLIPHHNKNIISHNNNNNHLSSNNRAKSKATGHASRNTAMPPQHPEKEDCMAIENGLEISGKQATSERASVLLTATALNPRENITQSKLQTSSTVRPRERRHKRNPRCRGEKDGKNDSSETEKFALLLPVPSISERNVEPTEHEFESKGGFRTSEPICEVTDSDSDLSDTERLPGPSSFPTSPSVPPQLHLRAEVIDPRDLQPSRPLCRGRSRSHDTYPDFLPPPFNSWSLQPLAVYLNTDGRAGPRPKPVGQLERYLERLLQLEWRQIQTIHEESGGPLCVPARGCRHRTHATPNSSLSAPKSILQCQRAFPLALLSSLTSAPHFQTMRCACAACHARYPVCNGACRLNSHPHHSHLSPLLEKTEKAPGVSKRSSSESRTQVGHRMEHRSHRLSDQSDGSNYLKRMQAVGNIRNPTVCPCGPLSPSCTTGTLGTTGYLGGRSIRKKGTGGRSHSCGDLREEGGRKARPERRMTAQHIKEESPAAAGSDDLHSSNNSVVSRHAGTPKRVEFVMH